MFDVIVVGARCGGSSSAMLLARRGYRVLLVDRATFPSDTLSTHFLPPRGGAMLSRWGLLDRLRATGCPPINPITFDVGPVAVTADPEPVDGTADSFCPRRTVLDQLLIDAAIEAGCEFRENTTVDNLVWREGRVVGIRGRSDDGGMFVEHARLVVGADGMRSRVARLVDAPAYDEQPAMIGVFYTYWDGFGSDHAEFYVRDGRHIFVFPTHDDLTCIYVSWRAGEFDSYKADAEANYLKTLELAPSVAERVRAANRVAALRGTNRLPNFYRKPYGPGWALVGDAGHHKDPTTGMGISDAFRDAQLLTDATHAAFSKESTVGDAMAGYEETRNRLSKHIYKWTIFSAMLADPAPLAPFLEAIKDDAEEATRFISVVTGTVPFWDVLGPENLQRVLAKTA